MAIYDQLAGAPGAGGRVVLICKKCQVAAEDAKTGQTVLKVCPQCGTPLGEWNTEAERNAELEEFQNKAKMYNAPPPKRYRIKITSGVQAGRFVGPNIGGGLITNPALLNNREVRVPGTPYSLYAQADAAMQFFEKGVESPRAQLRGLGYETELVEV
jgi:hypothetical protein